MLELKLKEKVKILGDNFHVVEFRYNGIVGHFSITDKFVYLCVLNDISPDGLMKEVQKHIQSGGTHDNLPTERILSKLLPEHIVNLDGLMEELEQIGLPAGEELPRYLRETQGTKFSEDFYAKLAKGLKLDGSEIQFGVPSPMGPLVGVLKRRDYKPLITEESDHFGEVQIYAKSIFQRAQD